MRLTELFLTTRDLPGTISTNAKIPLVGNNSNATTNLLIITLRVSSE